MLALGLALLILGGGLTLIFVFGGTNDTAVIDVVGLHADTNSMVVFLVGLAAGVVLLMGLALTRRGLAKDFRRRQETRKLRKRAETAERQVGAGGPTATDGDAGSTKTSGSEDGPTAGD
jgi:hypothetical protein